MSKAETNIRTWFVVNSSFFFFTDLVVCLHGWMAATAIQGFVPRFEITVLVFITNVLGLSLFLAPRRGQMTQTFASSLLAALACVMVGIVNILGRLADYAHIASSLGKTLR